MTHYFNTAGPCRAEDHYMLPPERRLHDFRRLIEQKAYFVLHAPRQTGKTTSLSALARKLTEEGRYAALHSSCEAAQAAGSDVDEGVRAVVRNLEEMSDDLPEACRPPPAAEVDHIEGLSRLQVYLRLWAQRSPLPKIGKMLGTIDAPGTYHCRRRLPCR